MTTKFSRFCLHVILPLIVGGLIYVCLRDPEMRMFQWFNLIGISPVVSRMRFATAPLQNVLPFWVQFSLPNALWVYSLTAFMALVWSETNSRSKLLWLSLGLLLGAGTEFGQALNLIPGSFDLVDLSLCVIATPLALLTTSNLPSVKRRLNDVTT